MALFDISFLNPFSSTSGIKLSSFSNFFQGDDSNIIVDKTILENVSCQYQIYIKEESIARRTHEGEGCFAREIAFLCGIFTGNHYSIFLNPQQSLGEKIPGVGGICSKGLFDLLILPLIARKILWDSLLFLSNPNHYQFSGDMNDLIKLICWLALLPAILLALAIETVKFVAAALLSTGLVLLVGAPLFLAVVLLIVVSAPVWYPINCLINAYFFPPLQPLPRFPQLEQNNNHVHLDNPNKVPQRPVIASQEGHFPSSEHSLCM